jgi:chitin disaccharide deacetylase
MRYLVVNADDFGSCSGVNRGIVESHVRGIVTSTSLMVGRAASEEAALLARDCPSLSVGLHASFEDERRQPLADLSDPGACRAALEEQLLCFTDLLGRGPTHLDSHHHVHTRPSLLPHFREVTERYGIPLRDCSGVRYCSRFYGQWAGERHPEQVSAAGFMRILQTDIADGITELACHPGYADRDLSSSYAVERELELRTLTDARLRRYLDRRGIVLVGFKQVAPLLAAPA